MSLKLLPGKCSVCGVANGATILRSDTDGTRYMYYDADADRHTLDGEPIRLSEIPEEYERDEYEYILLYQVEPGYLLCAYCKRKQTPRKARHRRANPDQLRLIP